MPSNHGGIAELAEGVQLKPAYKGKHLVFKSPFPQSLTHPLGKTMKFWNLCSSPQPNSQQHTLKLHIHTIAAKREAIMPPAIHAVHNI